MATRGQRGTPYGVGGGGGGTVQVPMHHHHHPYRHGSGLSGGSGPTNAGAGGAITGNNNNTNNNNNTLSSSSSLSSTQDEIMWVNVTWMPHSSLSQTSHVSLAVRSIHTILQEDYMYDSTNAQSRPKPEEFRVTITVHGMAGLPLSISSTTPSLPLIPRRKKQEKEGDESKSNSNINNANNNHEQQQEQQYEITNNNFEEIQSPTSSSNLLLAPTVSKATHDCFVNHLLQIPIRWRDLPRDAYLLIQVYSSIDTKLYETTFALFDTYGKLHTGLQRIELYEEDQDTNKNDKNKKHTNPGLSIPERLVGKSSSSSSSSGTMSASSGIVEHNYDNDSDDPLWEASRILDQLERFSTKTQPTRKDSSSVQSTSTTATAAIPDTNTSSSKPVGDPSTFGQVPSVPWLDTITKQHCQNVLLDAQQQNEQEENQKHHDEILLFHNSEETMTTSLPSYIILELPVFDVPIMHEETFYPLSTQGASGSVTGLELSLYRQGQGKKKLNAVEEEEKEKMIHPEAQEEEDMTLPLHLVPFLDHENENDNPVEDKYRTLAHDLLRGLVDPALKPDRTQRARLAAIIASPSHHPSREEKDLLWRFRFSLVDNRRALTKFLLAVDWTVESEVVQAAELLEQWRKRSPIEVTDALKLLGKHVAFQTSLVRAYAIDTLASAPDDELRLYLLQLVQALKYETSTTVDRLSQSANTNNSPTTTTNTSSPSAIVGVSSSGGTGSVSSLATFLINRASKNIELANYLYWYLKVELQDPTHGARYNEVFSAFRDKLSESIFTKSSGADGNQKLNPKDNHHNTNIGGSSGEASKDHHSHKGGKIMALADSVSKLGSSLRGSKESLSLSSDRSSPNKKHPAQVTTVWDVLVAQDSFISGIMDCQMQSRDARGKRDAKETHLRDSLSSKGFDRMEFAESVPLPSAPHILVKGVNPRTAKMFKSALYPALVEFRVDSSSSKHTSSKSLSHSGGSPTSMKKSSSSSTYKVIVKTGDDLRQDQLVIMMIKLMDGLLKRGTLDLCLKPYSIIATSPTAGLVEFVDGSIPISQILASHNSSIMQFFQSCAPGGEGTKYGVRPDVMQTYIRSCAGYCVITYILGVGDRHLDNIMLQPSGHFFHIDFGFIFGRDPKPLPPAFRLTREMVDGMGGLESTEYRQFRSLACQAFNTLRKSAGLVLNLLHLMSDAGIEDLSNNPSADSEGVISKVEERFRLELSDEQAETFFLGLINDSLAALAPRVMDVFHSLAVARR